MSYLKYGSKYYINRILNSIYDEYDYGKYDDYIYKTILYDVKPSTIRYSLNYTMPKQCDVTNIIDHENYPKITLKFGEGLEGIIITNDKTERPLNGKFKLVNDIQVTLPYGFIARTPMNYYSITDPNYNKEHTEYMWNGIINLSENQQLLDLSNNLPIKLATDVKFCAVEWVSVQVPANSTFVEYKGNKQFDPIEMKTSKESFVYI
jgi:hypothetical protein